MENKNSMPTSGFMTNNMEDCIWLGKQMERLRDGEQLEEDNRIPDPIQSDDVEEEKFKRKS
ncbi:hypothetical protein ACFPN4_05775 [Ureibacillus thermophilus]|uniref:Multidrug ABC transporter ATPase n=1 Tax=Ureibacillus thermophilus TaxID=367743 RepID=A0A4P6UVH4_9BACL|nr:hypothetical protein [Ureibacillus thermophilus]QBK26857.1 hypothetical protein DKZ56_13995 [Ureibacillus thermophilus]